MPDGFFPHYLGAKSLKDGVMKNLSWEIMLVS